MKHSTGNRLVSYCNCGRRTGTRDEPFTIREANYDFYQRLALECCAKLDGWKVPVFEERRDEKGEGLTLEEMLNIFIQKRKRTTEEEETEVVEQEAEDDRPISQSQLLERDLRQEEDEEEEVQDRGDDSEQPAQGATDKQDGSDEAKAVENGNAKEDMSGMGLSQDLVPAAQPLRLVTRIKPAVVGPAPVAKPAVGEDGDREYLPGMLHSRCPADLLPLFPSWSLIRFGSSRSVSHSVVFSFLTSPPTGNGS